MNDTAERYLATWNATDPAERRSLLQQHWAPDAVYVDPMADASGLDALDQLIGGVQAQFDGFVFTAVGEPDSHHQQTRFQWGLGPVGAEPVVLGFDVLVLDDEGRIAEVRGFLDRVPA
jgi:hypothetical protein